MSLGLKNIHISANGKAIVKGVWLEIKPGRVHAIMGPNGSGKSTLANALMGHPKYQITEGQILIDKQDLTSLAPDKRARAGLFLSLQHPPEIPGVTVANFLRLARQALTGESTGPLEFHRELLEQMKTFRMDPEFAKRQVHVGFSGGEKNAWRFSSSRCCARATRF